MDAGTRQLVATRPPKWVVYCLCCVPSKHKQQQAQSQATSMHIYAYDVVCHHAGTGTIALGGFQDARWRKLKQARTRSGVYTILSIARHHLGCLEPHRYLFGWSDKHS